MPLLWPGWSQRNCAMSLMLDKTLTEAALLAAPFLIGDSLKAVLAGLVTQAIAKARPEALLSRA
ncbi:MAG: hypothetical protein RI979_2295 [Pseudomonadota bacterium]